MQLHEFLSYLKVVSGPDANGNYKCKCPAHDDKTASLTVRQGDKGIVLQCFAKCPTDRVVAAMGLKMSDLFDQDKDRKAAPARKPAARKKGMAESLGDQVAAYPYTDADGALRFEVLRFEKRLPGGQREKTFRQRMPKEGGGYTWSVPAALRETTIYRLPEVAEAIRAGRPVYVVEGEKDADTLARLGIAATCNAGGAGRWLPSHAQLLRGADAVVLCDCDVAENGFVGQEHGWAVASSLHGVARRVRFPYLADACPDLPPKGDVTDMIGLMGDAAGLEALTQLVARTPVFDPKGMKPWITDPLGQAAQLFAQVPGYCVAGGRICQGAVDDNPKALANFVAVPRRIISLDDGLNLTQEIELDGWSIDGTRLPRCRVKTSEFDGMAWVTKNWDFRANLLPGTQTKDKLRYAISEVGRRSAERVMCYTHTGWRRIRGKWCYLYHGGAIGADDVTVDLGEGLSRYSLRSDAEGWDALSYQDGAMATLSLQGAVPARLLIPLLGTVFLAPLREFLQQTGVGPAYSLFLLGGTQVRKSTLAALVLSHFGNFNGHTLPASFSSTANAIRTKAFLAKDTVLAIDDFHPVSSQQERKKMTDVAQALSRAFGDGAGRDRLNADRSLQASAPPRSIALITGEDLPQIQQSGIARYYVLSVQWNDMANDKVLTQCQEVARMGYLQKCMYGYIEWLLGQVDALPDQLHDAFIRNREKAAQMCAGQQHRRSPEAIAHMMIGYDCMLRYMQHLEILDAGDCDLMREEAWATITAQAVKQSQELQEQRPTQIYLDSLQQLLGSKAVGVVDLNDLQAPRPKEMIGYMDNQYYYLLPGMAYRAVNKLCTDQGAIFPITEKMLNKQLREDGIIPKDLMTERSITRPKFVEGRCQRLLWLPRQVLDGKVNMEQQKLDGFVDTDEPLPDGFETKGGDGHA